MRIYNIIMKTIYIILGNTATKNPTSHMPHNLCSVLPLHNREFLFFYKKHVFFGLYLK